MNQSMSTAIFVIIFYIHSSPWKKLLRDHDCSNIILLGTGETWIVSLFHRLFCTKENSIDVAIGGANRNREFQLRLFSNISTPSFASLALPHNIDWGNAGHRGYHKEDTTRWPIDTRVAFSVIVCMHPWVLDLLILSIAVCWNTTHPLHCNVPRCWKSRQYWSNKRQRGHDDSTTLTFRFRLRFVALVFRIHPCSR